MSNCKICQALRRLPGVGQLWVLVDETQFCVWGAPGELPEVDIQEATQLGSYCCEEHALEALNDYLLQASATARWSDVRPIESCASCGRDFDTTKPHKVLALSFEEVTETTIEQLNVRYPARFCGSCVPT